jgi:beta-glucosidase
LLGAVYLPSLLILLLKMRYSYATLFAACALPMNVAAARGDWAASYAKAKAALPKLSLTDKTKIVTGLGWTKGPCVGNTGAVPEIGYPSLCLQDGPVGIRFVQNITAFPAGVQAASTWDADLMYARGNAQSTEAKALGVNVQLGPVAGPLGKIPRGGRNWEGFSPDPYLTGIAMYQTITGMQDAGVQACAKHFIGNEQEYQRETMSSDIDDRTLHELYMWPFVDSVKANVAAVMCSYNKLNGTWACESKEAMDGLLKGELGFKGYILSDWNAQHTLEAANAGLDMSMPGTDFSNNNMLWGPNLEAAVKNGTVPQKRVDDMVTRILAGWYLLGQDKNFPPVTWSSWNGGGGGPNVQDDHKVIARKVARDGTVLLKNVNNALPLKKPKSLAIVGSDAANNPAGPNACPDRGCTNGTLAIGWGSASVEFPYLIAPLDAIKEQAEKDGTKLATSTTDDPTQGATAAKAAETALVFINANSGEAYITVEGNAGDRINLEPWHNGNDLVKAVAEVNKKTIVVVHSVGPIILEPILALENVVAIVWAGLPGQESGNALVDIIYGSTSPNGKLPYTIAKKQSDYGADIVPGDDKFPEGLYIDYRHFDKRSIEPRYEFGFGLSYTKFKYSDLKVSGIRRPYGGSKREYSYSHDGLFETVATVSATIRNTGRREGAEIAQLYIGLPESAPDSPPKQLRGFQKLNLKQGAAGTVTFKLRRRDLSYWDVKAQKWVMPKGTFKVWVGASSRDIRLTGKL